MAASTTTYPPRPVIDRAALPPGPSELPVIGQTLRYMRNPIRLMQDGARYGDLVTLSTKPALVYLVNHPDLIRDVVVTHHQRLGRGPNVEVMKYLMGESVVTAMGAEHLHRRRLLQPAFARSRIEAHADVMQAYATEHQHGWAHGQSLDLAREMSALTLRIVVKTLFGAELDSHVHRIGAAFALSNNYISTRANQHPRMRRILHRLPVPFTRRFKRARADLDEIVYALIRQRRQADSAGDDLLSLLLESQFEDDDGAIRAMTDEQARNETVTLFAAGHETTAVTLTWAWYLLATHPAIYTRFLAELDDVIGRRAPILADLPNLTFTDQVISETLRLYPAIWFWGRMAFQPFDLGGYHIPAGAFILAPQLIAQRDARWFDEPLAFRPDRWTPEFRKTLPQFAYYPFGGGPRRCIGDGFAIMEAKLIMAAIGQRWKMRHDPRHRPAMLPLISLRPKGGMPMFLERRH